MIRRLSVFGLLIALVALPAISWADATSYAEAETGGFTIDTGNSIGAKVTAAILPTDGSTWEDPVNSVTATLRGSPTIGQEGATGDVVAGARFTDFDGTDDVIDMGQSYTQGASPIIGELATEGGPATAWILMNFDGNAGFFFGERDAGSTNFLVQYFSSALRWGDGSGNIQNIFGSTATGLTSFAAVAVNATTLTGYKDGSAGTTVDPGAADNASINLSIGANWDTYPTTATELSSKVYKVLLFDTDLSSAELSSLHSNPWQIWNASAPVTNEFDVNPTVQSRSDGAYTFSGSVDGTATVSFVACPLDQTAPTVSQVAAGNCTGDVAAEAADSASWSGSDTLTLTIESDPVAGTSPFPAYDAYATDGTNLVTLTGECLDGLLTETGRAYQNVNCPTGLTSIGMGSAVEEYNTAHDPDMAAGDILQCYEDTSPDGFTVEVSNDGFISYLNGDDTWQFVRCYGYDRSVEGFHAEQIEWWANLKTLLFDRRRAQ